ncbi:MAG: FAD:protein FMN transferase [Limnochordia bacterium]|nr:FAD:protein FMN transferase [Limnochordia bacterium]
MVKIEFCKTADGYVEERFPAMGTKITQRIVGSQGLLQAGRSKIIELERLLSFYDPDSDLTQLNQSAGGDWLTLHPITCEVLREARDYCLWTEGAFDATIAPLVAAWGIGTSHPLIPDPREIETLLPLVDGANIELSETGGRLPYEGQGIDLGGIAKGFAADYLSRFYQSSGIGSGLVNLGGNVLVWGAKSDGSPWRIGIQQPGRRRGVYMGYVELAAGCMASSGAYERNFRCRGRTYGHVLDPRTGYPVVHDLLGVTVVAKDGVCADALSTAIFVLGLKQGMQLVNKLESDAVIITRQGTVFVSMGLKDKFVSCSKEQVFYVGP